MRKSLLSVAGMAIVCLLVLGMPVGASAQGRGRGGGGGNAGDGGGGGRGIGGGNSGMGGVDRGIGTSSERSNGRADKGRGRASDNSGGRSDEGSERASLARENSRRADEDLDRHPGIARGLNMSANQLRDGYQLALQTNPNLKFGQFVAATRLSQNLGRRYPNINRDAILAGLASGRSIGQTLRDLGLGSNEAKEAEKRARRELEENRRRQ